MGRITIFSADDCFHCTRVAAELTRLNIPYVEINVTRYPSKRKDMQSLSGGRMSTPQVFFNTRHVGGADDTIALLAEWSRDKKRYRTPRERYDFEIGRFSHPSNKKFNLPQEDDSLTPVTPDVGVPLGRKETLLLLPNGNRAPAVEVTETLKKILPRGDNAQLHICYKNSFQGALAVKCLMVHYDITREQAVTFGCYLQENQILDHAVSGGSGASSRAVVFGYSKDLFRLTCHSQPDVLNSYLRWTQDVDPDCIRLTRRLSSLLSKVEMSSTEHSESGTIDYGSAFDDPTFPIFEGAVCELQGVNLEQMDGETKMAFGINVYNLMLKYAYMKVGFGSTRSSRHSFYSQVKFVVGGHAYSFNEWQNGILRGNQRAPHGLSRPFGSSHDPRAKLAVKDTDPRVHFALSSGTKTKSCLPIQYFSGTNIDEELDLASIVFCEDDDNVWVDPVRMEVCLSKIFSWYQADFASSNQRLLYKILDYLRGVKQQTLQRMLDSGEPIKLSFRDPSWSDSTSELSFDADTLKANGKACVVCGLVRKLRRKHTSTGLATAGFGTRLAL